MNIDRIVMAFAGALVFAGSLLAWLSSTYWLIVPLLVGVNLFQASFTGFCPMAILLKKIKVRSGVAFK